MPATVELLNLLLGIPELRGKPSQEESRRLAQRQLAALQLLEASARFDPAARHEQTLTHLAGLIRLCRAKVPAQRSRLPAWPANHRLSWDEFRQLPITRRDDLQDGGKAWMTSGPPPAFRSLGTSTTSGSTGKPLVTHQSRAQALLAKAQQLRFQRWHGFDLDARCAFVTSPVPLDDLEKAEGKKGRWSAPMGRGEAVRHSLLADTDVQLNWLMESGARYLSTYPSNLQALVKRSLELGRHPKNLDAVVLSSEPLSEELVALTREHWGSRCVGTYSANETGLIATAAPDGEGYLVEAESILVEVLDDDGRACQPGEIGRVVVTSLQDLLRPLIRYEVGDYAEVAAPLLATTESTGATTSGAGATESSATTSGGAGATESSATTSGAITLPRLRRIVGRERTMIRLPDGRQVWPHFEFASLIEKGGIRQWQLVHRKDGSMLVRVVPLGELSKELALEVRAVVQESLPGLEIEVQAVDAIARTARGKFMELAREDD